MFRARAWVVDPPRGIRPRDPPIVRSGGLDFTRIRQAVEPPHLVDVIICRLKSYKGQAELIAT